jgi:hypothetical protein
MRLELSKATMQKPCESAGVNVINNGKQRILVRKWHSLLVLFVFVRLF